MKRMMNYRIMGIQLPIYLGLTALVLFVTLMGWMPSDMIGAFAVMMILGGLFNAIGNNLPIVKTYLGGGAIVCIFASAALTTFKLIPESVVNNIDNFMNTTGFLNFYIAALITGSILGMNRTLLLRAAVRFLPVALCAMILAVLAVGIVGAIIGYGFSEAIMFVAIPMMGGGMGAGVVPLSGMYAQAMGQDASILISRMVPASTLGNVCAIIGAGLLARLGQAKPALTGNGKLMRKDAEELKDSKEMPTTVMNQGIGLILAMCFYLFGGIINKIVPAVHTYAWMIIAVAVCKAIGVIPDSFEQSAKQWSSFVMGNWTQALLVGIGVSMIDLNAVASTFSFTYLLLVLVVVGGVALGAGVGGWLVGFYPIESSITAGLCTTNMGGTGDIAVLSAANRMELLPFAQIATRICGALVLIVASILVQILL